MVGKSAERTIVWDLSKPITPENATELEGVDGKIMSHFLVDDRWLIVGNEERRLYYVDLNSDSAPRAQEFFQLQSAANSEYANGEAGGRFYVLDYHNKITYFWDAQQFENTASSLPSDDDTASPR
jgi:hypothetical protein